MATKLEAADLEKAIQGLVSAEQTNLGIEVSVPVVYGDGDLVTVVVESAGAEFVVHDAGFSAMRLTASGIGISRNVAQRLHEFCQRYKCSFSGGRVNAPSSRADLPTIACLVANAARSVGDYVYEIRTSSGIRFSWRRL